MANARKRLPPRRVLGPLDHGKRDEWLLAGLLRLDAAGVRRFQEALVEASARLGLDYVRESGERIVIPVTPMPAVPTRWQVKRLAGVVGTLARAVARLAARRLDEPGLAHVLELGAAELNWLRLAQTAPGRPHQQVLHRWDLAIDVAGDPRASRARFFEVNSVDVGGIHYAAATREVLLEALGAVGLGGLSLDAATAGCDPRLVLLAALDAHAKGIGRRLRFLAIAENQEFTTGITEAQSLARFFSARGLHTRCVDVRAFEPPGRRGVCVGGRPVDVIYRNVELRDLAELEAAGAELAGLRAAAAAGLLFSSPFGELDHKSLWEALGAPEHAGLFTPAERKLIARHIPWTRLVSQRRASGPQGDMIDLAPYVRRHRTALVLKPNRSCGGQGVTIGAATAQSVWDETLSCALDEPGTWVAQERIPIPRRRSVAAEPSGGFRRDTVYAVYGLFASAAGLGFVGRASHSPVVNVMQGGSMLGILGRNATA